MAKIFLPSHIWLRFFCRAMKWLRFFCRAIYGSVKKTCEKNGFSSDFWPLFPKEKGRNFSYSDISPDSFGVRGKPVLFLKEKGPGIGKSIEIGGNNGSFRAPISDRCPEGTSKTRESGKTRPFSDISPDSEGVGKISSFFFRLRVPSDSKGI